MEAGETEESSTLLETQLPIPEQEIESMCLKLRQSLWKLLLDIKVEISLLLEEELSQTKTRNGFSHVIKSKEGALGESIPYILGSVSLKNGERHSITHLDKLAECFPKNGKIITQCEPRSEDEVRKVLYIIGGFLVRGLPSSEKSANAECIIDHPLDFGLKPMVTHLLFRKNADDSEKETLQREAKPSLAFYKKTIVELRVEKNRLAADLKKCLIGGICEKELIETLSEETQQFEKNMNSKNGKLEQKLNSPEREAKQSLNYKVEELKKEIDEKNVKIDQLQEIVLKKEEELHVTLVQFGSLRFDYDKIINETKMENPQLKQFSSKSVQTMMMPNTSYYQASGNSSSELEAAKPAEVVANPAEVVAQASEAVAKPAEAVAKSDESSGEDRGAVRQNPIHEEESSNREGISLDNVPTTLVERSLYFNYKLLLLIMAQSLLSDDVAKLKEWARARHSIESTRDANKIFEELDRKRIISASDLKLLREFFEDILRIDLAHLIDCFMIGDYSCLRSAKSSAFPRNGFISRYPPRGAIIGTSPPPCAQGPTSDGKNPGFSSNVVQQCGVVVADSPTIKHDGARTSAVNTQRQASTTESRIPTVHSTSNHDNKLPDDMGSNGQKLSKLAKPDAQRNGGSDPQNNTSEDSGDTENWLCNHYKRRCHVKFACCEKYWPCHRCHNNESDCVQKRLKSIHTKFVKCVNCSTEQEFNETSQFCVNCHTKFAKYFCPTCKHLTGEDDNPYHCNQCGICRIHKHRSFHCDTCGVCLDVQLRDNHRCREGSAHDECCICLEDAFTGCQILPCSHKVHKECATKMIRSGITRCPICRESFAHKLEKRQVIKPVQKHHGKM